MPREERGQLDDPGSPTRFPNLGRSYHWWEGVTNQNVFAWRPKLDGRFRLWLSWGCGWKTHAEDARYLIDRDGNLETTGDQEEIARVDQRKFSDGTGDLPNQNLWSGFYFSGSHRLERSNLLVLRSGNTSAPVTADTILLEEELKDESSAVRELPHVRMPVSRGENSESFEQVQARFLRFSISETTQLEPCLDELEIFTDEAKPRNVALAASGAKASASSTLPGYDIHKLEHLNDGRYGNDWSWISNERGRGWVKIEFAKPESIRRVVWSRDRDKVPRYEDRTPTRYSIELSMDGEVWRRVASSEDRLPHNYHHKPRGILAVRGLTSEEKDKTQKLFSSREQFEKEIKELTALPKVYGGKFEKPTVTRRLHRGDPTQPRDEVRPGTLSMIGFHAVKLSAKAESFPTEEKERRLALARWITDPSNPLTARVMVNRLWHYHFGRGLVETPSDFGLNGARPSHPELLDWLASEFVESGWSLKAMHYLIVTSGTYRQSGGVASPADRGRSRPTHLVSLYGQQMLRDADNRLLWHFPSRRLEAEVLRDSILFVSGNLDLKAGGPGFDLFEPNANYVRVFNSKQELGPDTWRRMVYQMKPRMQLDDTFGAFDCPDAGQIAPRRTSSTTPLQALNFLNSPFLLQQSHFLAERLRREAGSDAKRQVVRAFQLLFSRPPSAEESAAAMKLIEENELQLFCRALFNANEFVFVE